MQAKTNYLQEIRFQHLADVGRQLEIGGLKRHQHAILFVHHDAHVGGHAGIELVFLSSGGNMSNGERLLIQMKLHLLTRCSPPVQPGSSEEPVCVLVGWRPLG